MKIKQKYLVGSLVAVVAAVGVVLVPASASAIPNQVDGTVFYDQNNNGVHDPGEPGIPGILVRYGTGSSAPQAITDTNGEYVFTGVSGTTTVEVFAGWFRSQCNSLNCAAGPGADNNFTVANQFITAPGTNGTAGATLNVGLIPDWDGQNTYATFPADGTTVTGTPVDVATRLSYGQGCSVGTTAQRLCDPGARVRFRIAIFNQGTDAISNPVFSLQSPVGHELDDSSWFDNGQAIPTANTITVLQSFDSALGYGVYQMSGTIPAGASSTMFIEMDILPAAIGSPQPYATSDPRDKQMVAQILGMDQTGDWDSQFCLSGDQNWLYGTCKLDPLGDHDATLASDHTDGATWNVTGTVEPRADSMEVAMSVTDPTAPIQVCSTGSPSPSTVTMAMQVTNTSTGDTPLRNIEITADIPAGLVFDVADNPGWFVGGDGKPHTFVNLHILPGAMVDLPLYLQVDPSFHLPPNSTTNLTVGSEIVAYDAAQVNGAGEFTPGSMTGTLAATDTVEATSVGCPQENNGNNGGNNGAGDDDMLAESGMNMAVPIISAIGLIGVGLAVTRLRP